MSHLTNTDNGAPDGVESSRAALAEMMRIALPAVVTMLSFAVMQFVDKLIVGRLSPEALAAAGNGGIASWVPASIAMGVLTVVNTFVSQNLGAGKPERGAAYAWNGLWMALAASIFWLVPCALALPWVFAGMRSLFELSPVSAEVMQMENDYGRILLLGMFFTLAARTISHYFYGMHRPMIVLVSTVSANVLNLALTYALVFGVWGFPQWGVAGAAIGTVVGSAFEAAIPMAVFLSPSYARDFGTRRGWRPSMKHVRDIARLGWPGGLMWGNEMVCWWVFMAGFVASFDLPGQPAVHNPAGWIAHQYIVLSFMPAMGLSIAVSAIVGKCVGMGRPDLAAKRTWLGVRLAMGYMGICAVCFVVFRTQLVRPFLPSDALPAQADEIMRVGARMLILVACFQLFDALAVTVSGALRGAGDTVWPGVATVALSWSIIIGGGWMFVRFAPGLESSGPWIAAALYIVALSLTLLGRFLGGRWRSLAVVQSDLAVALAVAAADGGEGLAPKAPGAESPAALAQEVAPVDSEGGNPLPGPPGLPGPS